MKNRLLGRQRVSPWQQRFFQDEAFQWAREYPDVARACLKVPPIPNQAPQPRTTTTTTLEEYLLFRQWPIPQDENQEYALRLVSHALSFPLTMAHYWTIAQESTAAVQQQQQNWCCVGARAESTLPPPLWKELLVATGNPSVRQWTIDFVGPDVVVPRQESNVDTDYPLTKTKLTLRCKHGGFFHNDPGLSNTNYNGFVLFNPGFGHPNHKEGWKPTLQLLMESPRPVLVTAHSSWDAERDANAFREYFPHTPLDYQENPFASRIVYKDPLPTTTGGSGGEDHYVSPNMFAAWIHPNY